MNLNHCPRWDSLVDAAIDCTHARRIRSLDFADQGLICLAITSSLGSGQSGSIYLTIYFTNTQLCDRLGAQITGVKLFVITQQSPHFAGILVDQCHGRHVLVSSSDHTVDPASGIDPCATDFRRDVRHSQAAQVHFFRNILSTLTGCPPVLLLNCWLDATASGCGAIACFGHTLRGGLANGPHDTRVRQSTHCGPWLARKTIHRRIFRRRIRSTTSPDGHQQLSNQDFQTISPAAAIRPGRPRVRTAGCARSAAWGRARRARARCGAGRRGSR